MISDKGKLTVANGTIIYEADKQICFVVREDQVESVEKIPLNDDEECKLIIRTKTSIIHTVTNNDEECEDIISKMYEDIKEMLLGKLQKIIGTETSPSASKP